MTTLDDFDTAAALLHEAEMEAFWRKCQFAVFAEQHRAKSRLAYLWHCSGNTVTNYAQRALAVPEEWRICNTSVAIIDAAILCAEEHKDSHRHNRRNAGWWLLVAERFELSARQLKDLADVGRGRKVSRVDWVRDDDAKILSVMPYTGDDGDAAMVTFSTQNIPSGEMPKRAQVRVVEVLE
jgi:hypothetical protein